MYRIIFKLIFAGSIFCLLLLTDVFADYYYSSQDLSKISIGVVLDRRFMSQWDRRVARTIRTIVSSAVKNWLQHARVNVEYYTTSDTILGNDLTAVLSLASCTGTWELYKYAEDESLLHLAITEADCPRLPLTEAITVPLSSNGEELPQLIIDLKTTNSLLWKSVIILSDETIDNAVIQRIITSLSHRQNDHRGGYIAISLYNIQSADTEWRRRKRVSHVLKKLPVDKLGSNFLVLASHTMIGIIMEVAKSTGLVHPLSQWLYIIPDTEERHDDIEGLVSLLSDGENVAFLYNSTLKSSGCVGGPLCHAREMIRSFISALDSTIREEIKLSNEVSEEEWEAIRPSKMDRRNSLLSLMKRDLLAHGWCGNCTTWKLQAGDTWGVQFQNHHRNSLLQNVGTWNPREGLQFTDRLFPNVGYGFRGRTLPFMSFHYPPWQVFTYNETGQVSIHRGVTFNIINELSKRLNFSYKVLYPTRGNENGSPTTTNTTYESKENHEGTADPNVITVPWEAVVEALHTKKVFLGAAALKVNEKREAVVNFTLPIGIEPYTFLVSKPRELSRALLFIYPFATQTWICIIISVAIMGPLLNYFHRHSPYYEYYGRQHTAGLCRLSNCMWYVYGAILQQGGMHLPEADSARIVVGTWWLVVLVIVTTYCGNLVAFLTFPRLADAIKTIDELLEQRGYITWGFLSGSEIAGLLKKSDQVRLKHLYEGAIQHEEKDKALMTRIKHGGHVFFDWKINLRFLMKSEYLSTNRCDYTLGEEEILEEKLGMAVAPGNPYLGIFNEEIKRMHQVGLIGKWLQEYLPEKDKCTVTSHTAEATTHTVNLDDMQGSFFVLFLGFFFAAILISTECFLYRRKVARERVVIKPFVS